MRAAFATTSSLLLALGLAGTAAAQTFDDLTLVRSRPPEFASLLEIRTGLAGGLPDGEDPAIGREDEFGFDGHLYYHNGRLSSREGMFDFYVGRDGAYLNIGENKADGSSSRLELTARYAQFYREGFFRDDEFIPTFQYDAEDYGIYFGFAGAAAEGLLVEIGPYLRFNRFDRSDLTAPENVLPDDYRAFGVRTTAEQNTLQLDRSNGRPGAGFIFTVGVEAEWNDSDQLFGTPSYSSELPDILWRGRAHLEWYLPQGGLGTWAIRVDGRLADQDDRIRNYDAWLPVGHTWVDGDIGMRFDFGGLSLEPFGSVQWVRALEEGGAGSNTQTFFGGGAKLRWDLAEAFAVYANYSFLENPSRAPISLSQDTLGEHQIFVGLEFRIGAKRL